MAEFYTAGFLSRSRAGLGRSRLQTRSSGCFCFSSSAWLLRRARLCRLSLLMRWLCFCCRTEPADLIRRQESRPLAARPALLSWCPMACQGSFIACAIALICLLGWTSWFQRKVPDPSGWKTETAGLADLPAPNLRRRHFCFEVSSPAGSLTAPSGRPWWASVFCFA